MLTNERGPPGKDSGEPAVFWALGHLIGRRHLVEKYVRGTDVEDSAANTWLAEYKYGEAEPEENAGLQVVPRRRERQPLPGLRFIVASHEEAAVHIHLHEPKDEAARAVTCDCADLVKRIAERHVVRRPNGSRLEIKCADPFEYRLADN